MQENVTAGPWEELIRKGQSSFLVTDGNISIDRRDQNSLIFHFYDFEEAFLICAVATEAWRSGCLLSYCQ